MLHFSEKKNDNGSLGFKVELDHSFNNFFNHVTNLKVRFCRINPDDFWEHEIGPGRWVSYESGENKIINVQLLENNSVIYEKKYDPLILGSDLDKIFSLYCKLNKNTKGIVVGSHDGTWGHWVPSVLDKETDAIIIEGSEKQFQSLKKIYGFKKNCILLHQIVSTDGNDVDWYTGGAGFTDSVVMEVPKFFMDESEITKERRSTKTLNELIKYYNYDDYDWLHTDVEGYDAKLIMSIERLPKLIIFENEHIKKSHEYELLCSYLIDKNYQIYEYGQDTLALSS